MAQGAHNIQARAIGQAQVNQRQIKRPLGHAGQRLIHAPGSRDLHARKCGTGHLGEPFADGGQVFNDQGMLHATMVADASVNGLAARHRQPGPPAAR